MCEREWRVMMKTVAVYVSDGTLSKLLVERSLIWWLGMERVNDVKLFRLVIS